jgi:RsiG-like
VDAFPDLPSLTDAELKALIERKVEQEREVSRRRMVLFGQLKALKAEQMSRLREQYSDAVPAED